MRDNYIGDRADYYKYGLLLPFCRANLRLGIIWYRFPDPEPLSTGHGSDIRYLKDARYQLCNPSLFASLADIANLPSFERKVELIRTAGIFPADTIFFEELLSFTEHPLFLERRLHRKAWFQEAFDSTASCDVVYLDPDTGFETKTTLAYQSDSGPKYVAYDEVKRFIERGQTVIIYQNRHREVAQDIANQIRQNLRLYLNFFGDIPVYYFNAGQADRMFVILPAQRHQAQIESVLADYEASPWQHFLRRL